MKPLTKKASGIDIFLDFGNFPKFQKLKPQLQIFQIRTLDFSYWNAYWKSLTNWHFPRFSDFSGNLEVFLVRTLDFSLLKRLPKKLQKLQFSRIFKIFRNSRPHTRRRALAPTLPAHCFACILGPPSLTTIRTLRSKLLLGNEDSPMRKPLFWKSSFWRLGALFGSRRLLRTPPGPVLRPRWPPKSARKRPRNWSKNWSKIGTAFE